VRDEDSKDPDKPRMILSYEMDAFNVVKCEVTDKIPSVREFGTFANVISDALQLSEVTT
jgi:hypothetical protein